MPTDCKATNRYWNFTMCTRSLSFIYLIFHGHRPVINPYDSIKYFDLEAGTVLFQIRRYVANCPQEHWHSKLAVTQIIEYLPTAPSGVKNYFIDINPSLYGTVQSVEEESATLFL